MFYLFYCQRFVDIKIFRNFVPGIFVVGFQAWKFWKFDQLLVYQHCIQVLSKTFVNYYNNLEFIKLIQTNHFAQFWNDVDAL